MAKATRKKRIEPSFGKPASTKKAGFSVGAADRILPSQKRKSSSTRRKGARRKAKRGNKSGVMHFMGRAAYWTFVLAIWGGIAAAGMIIFYGAKMPSVTTWTIPDRAPNVKIVDMQGTLLANRGMNGGEALGLHEMSPFIPQAVVAIEDRRFFNHWGVDPAGLARAMVENLMQGRLSQGGSTITQQLAKNLYLTPERTVERKVQEMLLALWMEQKYTKKQILEMYLNRVYFGSGAYGVEAASQRYFNKSASDVTLAEAALLAGLLKAPSRLSPARDPQAAESRAQVVLTTMRSQNMIGDSQLAAAMSAPATRASAFWTGSEHYVADRIMEELPALIGSVDTDIVVETMVDMRLQKTAEKAIRRIIDEKGKKLQVSQGALVSIDRNGAIKAMVGGYDYAHSQFDRASEARRQPGSAFKPFVYLAALENGSTPLSIRNDAPVRIGNWQPENYQKKYQGEVTLTQALARSLNSVAAQLVMETGPSRVVETAYRLGIESKLNANASIALGTSEVTPLELTAAYLPFANGGFRPEIHFIKRISTVKGKTLYQYKSPPAPRVINDEVVGMMNFMMSETIGSGSARSADFGWPAAGKTGTTQSSRDAWFVGYTAELVTGVWFGNDDGRSTTTTGSSIPVEAWREFMAAAHQGRQMELLPGNWSPARQVLPSPVMAQQAEPMPAIQDQRSRAGMPPSQQPAAQTRRHPVPSAGVGEQQQQRRERTILDVILGN